MSLTYGSSSVSVRSGGSFWHALLAYASRTPICLEAY